MYTITSVYGLRYTYIHICADKSSDTQTQTLEGIHRSAFHKPYHDVRWQLCARSRPFSAQPCGHVGSQNPQWRIREQLSNWRLGEKANYLDPFYVTYSLSCDMISHMKNTAFALITHDSDLFFGSTDWVLYFPWAWGNYSFLKTVLDTVAMLSTTAGEQRGILTRL